MGKGLIALVDDDALVRSAMVSLLRSTDYECDAFASAEDFLRAPDCPCQCVVSDVQMPGLSGMDLARQLALRPFPPPVILVTAYPDAAVRAAKASGLVRDVVEKPLDGARFLAAVALAVRDG